MKIKSDYSNEPQWKEVTVKSTLPKELACLDELAHNMWWAWNYEARNMFKALDEELYEEVGHNPVQLLTVIAKTLKELDRDLSSVSLRFHVCHSSSVRLSSLRIMICSWLVVSFLVLISG